MDRFVIEGPTRLVGEVTVGGAKNAVLPLMASALLARGESVIENVPDLRDVRTFARLLDILGARCTFAGDTLHIDTTDLTGIEAPYDLVKTMRASIYVLGPLLASRHEARVSLPGGCAWGPRPVNLHLEGLRKLGAELELEEGYINARAVGGLKGDTFKFEPTSVGATCNVLMASVLAEGRTELLNCAIEPEVTQLVEALVDSGAQIEGAGTRTLVIEGVKEIRPLRTRVIPDRIEAGTFLAAAAITGGEISVRSCRPDHLEAVINVMQGMGCRIESAGDVIDISAPDRLRPIASLAGGVSFITDTIYPDRFTHVAELKRLGAEIEMDGATAVIKGCESLKGAPVMATDLRASAALILAGIAAEGVTQVDRVYHIDRGYEKIESKLASLGASIRREKA